MFGLTGPEGNHGEDVKEYWWYLDAVPSSAWLRWRYHYPQAALPVRGPGRDQPRAVQVRARVRAARHRHLRRRPLLDRRGPLRQGEPDRHPDADHRPQPGPGGRHAPRPADAVVPQRVVVEPRARPSPSCGRARTAGRSWRATRSWATTRSTSARARTGRSRRCCSARTRPTARRIYGVAVDHAVPEGRHQRPRDRRCRDGQPGRRRHEGRAVVPAGRAARRDGRAPAAPAQAAQGGQASRRERRGAGAAAAATAEGGKGGNGKAAAEDVEPIDPLGPSFESTMKRRESEADDFYAALRREGGTDDEQRIMRQAFAGMLWSKQYYGYNVARWLDGDPGLPPPPPERQHGRNADWRHFDAADILSMPDQWEYPWFAAWDLAFHAVTLRPHRPGLREVPAAADVPRVVPAPQRRAARLRVVVRRRQPAGPRRGRVPRVRDRRARATSSSCARIFHKLLINFTWWLNRQDTEGNDLFSGGFLGLDNIGAFDRSHLPAGTELEQSDATAWMFQYCLSMLRDRDRRCPRTTRPTRTSRRRSSSTPSGSPRR